MAGELIDHQMMDRSELLTLSIVDGGSIRNARTIAKLIDDYEERLPAGGWPNWVLGNHDRPRVASRVGREQARIAAMLLLTLRGTPTIYYGDEIGMAQVPIPALPRRLKPRKLTEPMRGPIRAGSVAAPRECPVPLAWSPGHSVPGRSRDR